MSSESLRSFPSADLLISKLKFRKVGRELWLDEDSTRSSIANGDDSFVFLIPETNEVMKFYCREPWLDKNNYQKLELYKKITNLASKTAENEDWKKYFPNSQKELKIRINPYNDLVWSQRGNCPVGVAPFVSGANMMDELGTLYLDKGIVPVEIFEWFFEINSKIQKTFNVSGVDVFPMNVKIIDSSTEPTILITDLCTRIERFKSN